MLFWSRNLYHALNIAIECIQRRWRSQGASFSKFAAFARSHPQGQNPVKTMKRFAPASLLLIFILYFLCNVAYFAAREFCILFPHQDLHADSSPVSKEDIESSGLLIANQFFTAVFGSQRASSALSALIAISSFGSILAIAVGSSRVIRECGR
jgi:amino acid transporter